MNWGEPDKMNGLFMYALDAWAEFAQLDVYVTPHGGTLGIHKPGSLHPLGTATDFMVLNPGGKTLLDIFFSLNRFAFTELGIYPHWEYKGSRVGGFHAGLDTRVSITSVRRKYWMGVKDNDGSTKYLGVNQLNFKAYGVI